MKVFFLRFSIKLVRKAALVFSEVVNGKLMWSKARLKYLSGFARNNIFFVYAELCHISYDAQLSPQKKTSVIMGEALLQAQSTSEKTEE